MATTEQWIVFLGKGGIGVSCPALPSTNCTVTGTAGNLEDFSTVMNTPAQGNVDWNSVNMSFTPTNANLSGGSAILTFLAWGDGGSDVNEPPTVFLEGVNTTPVVPEPATSVAALGSALWVSAHSICVGAPRATPQSDHPIDRRAWTGLCLDPGANLPHRLRTTKSGRRLCLHFSIPSIFTHSCSARSGSARGCCCWPWSSCRWSACSRCVDGNSSARASPATSASYFISGLVAEPAIDPAAGAGRARRARRCAVAPSGGGRGLADLGARGRGVGRGRDRLLLGPSLDPRNPVSVALPFGSPQSAQSSISWSAPAPIRSTMCSPDCAA